MPPRATPRQSQTAAKTEEPAVVLDFGEKDEGLIRVVLFGKSYDISPCREVLWINDQIKSALTAAGLNPEDLSLFTPQRASDATREWIKKLTQKDVSYELALKVYNTLDEHAQGRLRFFDLGPNSPTDSESARGPSQPE